MTDPICKTCGQHTARRPENRKWCADCTPLFDKPRVTRVEDIAPEPNLTKRAWPKGEFVWLAHLRGPLAAGVPDQLHPLRDVARFMWRTLWLKQHLASAGLFPKEPPKAESAPLGGPTPAAPSVVEVDPRPAVGELIEVLLNDTWCDAVVEWHHVGSPGVFYGRSTDGFVFGALPGGEGKDWRRVAKAPSVTAPPARPPIGAEVELRYNWDGVWRPVRVVTHTAGPTGFCVQVGRVSVALYLADFGTRWRYCGTAMFSLNELVPF